MVKSDTYGSLKYSTRETGWTAGYYTYSILCAIVYDYTEDMHFLLSGSPGRIGTYIHVKESKSSYNLIQMTSVLIIM